MLVPGGQTVAGGKGGSSREPQVGRKAAGRQHPWVAAAYGSFVLELWKLLQVGCRIEPRPLGLPACATAREGHVIINPASFCHHPCSLMNRRNLLLFAAGLRSVQAEMPPGELDMLKQARAFLASFPA